MTESADRSSELSALCQACGACCSGAMFGHVPVDAGELSDTTRRRLNVIAAADGKEHFMLPCHALEGSRCGVYLDRPRVCREYTCGLHKEHEREGGELEQRLIKVRRIRELLNKIRTRAAADKGEWLPAPIGEIAQWDASKVAALREIVGEETLLDIAELGMRVRRDLGHVPKH